MPNAQDAEEPRYIPTSTEEALAIARTRYAPVWPDGTPAPLHAEEFDVGYLVYATFPPITDLSRPPAEPGGSQIIVSKVNGEVSWVPNSPPEQAIATYRKFYRPSDPARNE